MVEGIAKDEYNKAWDEILDRIPVSLERHQRMVIYRDCRIRQNISHEDAIKKALISTELPFVIFEVADGGRTNWDTIYWRSSQKR